LSAHKKQGVAHVARRPEECAPPVKRTIRTIASSIRDRIMASNDPSAFPSPFPSSPPRSAFPSVTSFKSSLLHRQKRELYGHPSSGQCIMHVAFRPVDKAPINLLSLVNGTLRPTSTDAFSRHRFLFSLRRPSALRKKEHKICKGRRGPCQITLISDHNQQNKRI
jgi:hypothetical protein